MNLSNTIAKRRWWFLVGGLLVASVFLPPWSAVVGAGAKNDLAAGPAASDRQTVFTVTGLLRREHLSRQPISAEIADRTVTSLLKSLDPMKMYFYQSDVDAFMARRGEIEDLPRSGDVSLAYTIFRTFLDRIDQRVKTADELLAMQHDFTAKEEMVVDKDLLTYPKTVEEAREKWRKRIKYELLVAKADRIEAQAKREAKAKDAAKEAAKDAPAKAAAAKEDEDPVARLTRRYHSFQKRMRQIDRQELLEMYLSAVCGSFDPHTSYMAPRTVENFEIQMGLQLEGIGAALQWVDGYTIVHRIIPGGAADKDGRLKVEDRVIGVGQGESGPIEDVVEMKLSDVVDMIRGKAGTVVRLEVMPAGTSEKKVINIVRAKIELRDSEARGKVFEAGHKPDGKPYKIGVLKLPSFYMDMAGARAGVPEYRSTTRDVHRILDEFNEQGVDGLVLDLRDNGGGSLQEAISLTGLFVGDGPIVQVKGSDGRVQLYNSSDVKQVWTRPMIVLINKFSASASEILAGAIQDYRRGLIVGDRATHGKGTVQSLLDLGEQLFRIPNAPKLGALKITMQQFYRPSGDSTQRRGVVADIELPSLTTHFNVGEGDLDHALAFDKVDARPCEQFSLVNGSLVQRLKDGSEKRIRGSEDFQRQVRNITRYQEQKNRKTVTLNEEEFMAQRAGMNADREEEKKFEELSREEGEIKRDYYLDEALALSGDYLGLIAAAPAPSPAPATAAQVAPRE